MDGMLSQDEINALLSGMDLGASQNDADSSSQDSGMVDGLSDIEKDAVGEVANISMGTSATTLYSLVNRKVNITTPVVTMSTWDSLIKDYVKEDKNSEYITLEELEMINTVHLEALSLLCTE